MDGVFMKKTLQCLRICLLLFVLIWMGSILKDRKQLNEELIRLHVVAESDSEEDQSVKLLVRDAVTAYLKDTMGSISDVQQAKDYIQSQMPKIETIANQVLAETGINASAVVSFAKETFDTRFYDTFKLPAGVYESLRIVIGEGQGKNWWCVVFPTLCLPATTDGFESVAAGAGFDDDLTGALEGKTKYEIRFFLLDWLGKTENSFFKG